ncbi:MAG: hypothetical protein JWQ63_3605 [Mucilaginibacter sp.]|nr:hypothetical protein [Mucilaginibacter sp.]
MHDFRIKTAYSFYFNNKSYKYDSLRLIYKKIIIRGKMALYEEINSQLCLLYVQFILNSSGNYRLCPITKRNINSTLHHSIPDNGQKLLYG